MQKVPLWRFLPPSLFSKRIDATRRCIIVAGSSGVVGLHIVATLLSEGHTVLNLDIAPGPFTMHTVKPELTNIGDMYNALTSHLP
jgi:hypothetical protein